MAKAEMVLCCTGCIAKEEQINKLREKVRMLKEREAHRIASENHFFSSSHGDEW